MISGRMSRPGAIEHGPRSGHLEASSPRRHHGAGRNAVPTPERTMTPVRHKIRALVGEAAIRELSLRDFPRLSPISAYPATVGVLSIIGAKPSYTLLPSPNSMLHPQ